MRTGGDGLFARLRFLDPLWQKAHLDQQVQPSAHRPVESRRLEFRETFLCLLWRRAEAPPGDLALGIAKVAADLAGVAYAPLVAQVPAMGRGETWMLDRELQKATGAEHPVRFGQ